jgi:hypothetical protein
VQGAIPFVDYGGKYLSVGASYDPGVLQGLTWAPLTAALCELTGNRPATACTSTVRSL